MQNGLTKVLYISGIGRSGSTVLGRILGHAEGWVHLGEGHGVWTRCLVKNELCSCGIPFRTCPFWQTVFQEAYGGFDTLHAERVVEDGHPLVRRLYMLMLLLPWKTPVQRRRLDTISRTLEKLYRSVASVTRSRVIVDSSKPPGFALMLGSTPNIDLHILHLVRDSRGMAFSALRRKFKWEIDGRRVYMRAHPPAESALEWVGSNVLSELLRYRKLKYLLVRYEDFVAEPRTTLERIGDFVGEDLSGLPFVDERTLELGVTHSASGNPNRFQQGRVEIRADTEWQAKMRPADRLLVTALTWPLQLRYGYMGSRMKQQARSGRLVSGHG